MKGQLLCVKGMTEFFSKKEEKIEKTNKIMCVTKMFRLNRFWITTQFQLGSYQMRIGVLPETM